MHGDFIKSGVFSKLFSNIPLIAYYAEILKIQTSIKTSPKPNVQSECNDSKGTLQIVYILTMFCLEDLNGAVPEEPAAVTRGIVSIGSLCHSRGNIH